MLVSCRSQHGLAEENRILDTGADDDDDDDDDEDDDEDDEDDMDE